MGTIVCKECDNIISAVPSDKAEVLYGVCPDCHNHDHKDQK